MLSLRTGGHALRRPMRVPLSPLTTLQPLGQLLRPGAARLIHIDRLERGADSGAEAETGGGDTGKYRAGLFIDKVFPIKMAAFDIRPYIWSRSIEAMKKKVSGLLPKQLPHQFAVCEIEPHKRDGGSIVYFTFSAPGTQDDAKRVAEGLVSAVNTELATRDKRSWYEFEPARSLPVRGVPFSEDIVRMLPSKKIKVEFVGPDLTVEQLYGEFREFGLILDIETQPTSNKDTPRWAIVHYSQLRGATRARNCAHGDVVGSTRLLLSYVRENHTNVVIQWFREHTKFTIPLAAAALIAAIYAIFDPIREFFVENKITHRFDLSQIPILGNMRKAAMRSLLRRDPSFSSDEMSAWTGLFDQKERLVSILNEPPESFVVVTGPHGSGKTKLVELATQEKKYRVVIDANNLASQHSELEQMTLLARQLGWWPVFNSIISITNTIDLMVTATTGSKPGISATPESQVRRILECLALVLTKIRHSRLEVLNANEQRKRRAHQAQESQGGNAAADYGSSSHALSPEDIPVIVLENFMDKDLAFSKIIIEWAASVVEAGLAHCIITTNSISGYHEVQRVESNRATSLISLDDSSPMGAITLLQRQLTPEAPALVPTPDALDKNALQAQEQLMEEYQRKLDAVSGDQIAYAADVLGGRLEDLQIFVQKVKAGESIGAAIEDIIQRSITEIRKHAFDNDSEVGQCKHTWSPEQFWYLLTELARHESVEYDRMRNSALFAGNDSALLGLAEAQLITMVYDNDRPSRIRPGRPVFFTAFGRIIDDPGFSSTMAIRMHKAFVDLETAKIRKAEEELALLNVFKASVDSYNTLASNLAIVAASKDISGASGSGDGWWPRNKAKAKDGDLAQMYPEAYIAQATRKTPQTSEHSQSWLGWLFGRSSPPQSQPPNASSEQQPDGARPMAVPGVPFELQGRVRFLLNVIHSSQQKIDKWDEEIKSRAARLAGL
ncbi:mitochondrial escape protein 2 [Coemansia spiralis]|uniref:Mitochondrial escape protein 2 n=1 Tax=Coemansia spiralis TaxID=417178 RepID=A0A9W8GGI3_9FUNG|nr:mitochondrial escape protein 2 [Coemansia spiralis]